MKKALVLGLLSCLLFDAEGMKHNKKLSSSSSKSSSGLLKLPTVVTGEPYEIDKKAGLGWGYKAECDGCCTCIKLFFDSWGEASETANAFLEIYAQKNKNDVEEVSFGNVECDGNVLKFEILDDSKRSKIICIQPRDFAVPMPTDCKFYLDKYND